MKFCVLSSGSKGNCTYIEINNHKYLIDIGTNFLYVSNKLKEINVDPAEIEGIFITHAHKDHTSGLKRTIKMINPKIYLSEKIKNEINEDIYNYQILEKNNIIDNIKIKTLKLSHDVQECLGYIFEYENKDFVYITDTGYINQKHNKDLKNRCAYIIESNHDIDLLMNSAKPHFLKLRILGDEGHISNKDCSYYLKQFIGEKTDKIILAHLSEENNDKDIAIKTVLEELEYNKFITTASQNERTEVFNI